LLGPGASNRATMPATNPTMMIQMMPMAASACPGDGGLRD
jgi:hypothetical protein